MAVTSELLNSAPSKKFYTEQILVIVNMKILWLS